MNRFALVLLAVAALGLGGYAWHLHSELTATRHQLAAAEAARTAAQAAEQTARNETAPLEANVARLTAERDRYREAAKAGGGATDPAQPGTPPKADASNPLAGIFQSMDTPEMRKMMRNQAVSEARRSYADLLKKWRLPPAEGEQFIQFIADRDTRDFDMFSAFKDGAFDQTKAAELNTKMETAEEESKKRLKSLLGDQRYAEFEAHESQQTQREGLANYESNLSAAGAPLDDRQRGELAKILDEERQGALLKQGKEREMEDLKLVTGGVTDEQLAQIRQREEAFHGKVVQRAAGVLNPDQVSALQAAFKEELDEQEMSYKMMRGLMQSGALGPGKLEEGAGGKPTIIFKTKPIEAR